MSKTPAELAREQRLAAKLRENLKRRKHQARARTPVSQPSAAEPIEPAESAANPALSPDADTNS